MTDVQQFRTAKVIEKTVSYLELRNAEIALLYGEETPYLALSRIKGNYCIFLGNVFGYPNPQFKDNDYVATFLEKVMNIEHTENGTLITMLSGVKILIRSWSTKYMCFLKDYYISYLRNNSKPPYSYCENLSDWTIEASPLCAKIKGSLEGSNCDVHGCIVSQYENLVMLSNGKLYLLV